MSLGLGLPLVWVFSAVAVGKFDKLWENLSYSSMCTALNSFVREATAAHACHFHPAVAASVSIQLNEKNNYGRFRIEGSICVKWTTF